MPCTEEGNAVPYEKAALSSAKKRAVAHEEENVLSHTGKRMPSCMIARGDVAMRKEAPSRTKK
jgi:hypothetical protein